MLNSAFCEFSIRALMKSFYLIKPYIQENRLRIVLGIICLITVDFLQLFIPRVIKWAIDDLAALQTDLMELLAYALYIAGIAVLIEIGRASCRERV